MSSATSSHSGEKKLLTTKIAALLVKCLMNLKFFLQPPKEACLMQEFFGLILLQRSLPARKKIGKRQQWLINILLIILSTMNMEVHTGLFHQTGNHLKPENRFMHRHFLFMDLQ